MSTRQARTIVDSALALLRTHPDAPALDVLDQVMEGHHGTSPDFDAPGQHFGNWIDPPSPFGELLRRAFAPDDIGPDAAELWQSEVDIDQRGALVDAAWEIRVVTPFAQRYGLWGG